MPIFNGSSFILLWFTSPSPIPGENLQQLLIIFCHSLLIFFRLIFQYGRDLRSGLCLCHSFRKIDAKNLLRSTESGRVRTFDGAILVCGHRNVSGIHRL